MKAQIIQIGNSHGVRIPKALLEESKLAGEVQLEVHSGGMLIRRSRKPRANWDERFTSLIEHGEDDQVVDADPPNAFEKKEWQW